MGLLGVLAALYSARHGFHGETRPPVQSAAFPLSLLTWFSGFVIAGLSLRKWLLGQATDAAGLGRNHRPRGRQIEGLPYPDWLPNCGTGDSIRGAARRVGSRDHSAAAPSDTDRRARVRAAFPVRFVVWTTPWWMHMITTLIS